MKIAKINCLALLILAGVIILVSGCVSVFVKPSNMVGLAEVVAPGETKILRTGTPQGTGGGVYQVPGGKFLVVTRVIIQPMNLGSGSFDLTFMQSDSTLGDRIRHTWWIPKSQPTEYDFTPGELISSGSTMKVRNNGTSGDDAAVMIFGYVTSNE